MNDSRFYLIELKDGTCTVACRDSYGDYHDLNHGQDPCRDPDSLEDLIHNLFEDGVYSSAVRDELLGELL